MSYRRDVEDRMENPNLLKDTGINPPQLAKLRTEPVQRYVELAEELLAQAKRGEIAAMGYAIVLTAEGGIQTSFANVTGTNSFTLLGAFERLKLRYHNVVIGETE
jgi:hypothetical protein